MRTASREEDESDQAPGGPRQGSGFYLREGGVVEAALEEEAVEAGLATPATALPIVVPPHAIGVPSLVLATPARFAKPPPRLLATMPTSGAPGAARYLPFSQSSPGLTLEQMASLDVELQAWPEARPATLARYGIGGEKEMAALVASWVARLGRDPSLVRRWNKACDTYRVWLKERTTA